MVMSLMEKVHVSVKVTAHGQDLLQPVNVRFPSYYMLLQQFTQMLSWLWLSTQIVAFMNSLL